MFCQKCGNQLNEGAAFCPKCGAKVDAASSIPMQTATANNEKTVKLPKSKRGIMIVSIIVILLLLVIKSCTSHNGDETYAIKKALPGTWTASFGDGSYECRLHFDKEGEKGAAMLIDRECGGTYFEVIYRGDIEFAPGSTIMLYNVSNPDNPDHAFEIDRMPIPYTYNSGTKELTLTSSFLSAYLTTNVELQFTHTDEGYYDNLGERVYSWEALFN